MKPRLVILSDLWGSSRSEWTTIYIKNLKNHFDIQYYDSCQLGSIDISDYQQENIHKQFLDYGINKAIEKLLLLEKGNINILAFSIGGTIAWKAGIRGLKIEKLYSVSSTKLRYEKGKPNVPIKLYFGEEDPFKPSYDWFEKTKVNFDILPGKDHEMYMDQEFALKLCEKIKRINN